jgi:hypothetical protein
VGPDERDTARERGPDASAEDDLSIVPGLTGLPAPREELPGRLDPALDPDRYDPSRDAELAAGPPGGLDPALDPDRYDPRRDLPPGQGQTLTDLLGEGAHEEPRDNYQWALGLLGMVVFLALVSWLFGSVFSP